MDMSRQPYKGHIFLTLVLYYFIIIIIVFLHQCYKSTHLFHPGYKNAPLGAINLLTNNIKMNVNEVTLYQLKLKSMKRKIIYYPLNEKRS
jgi:hypothetical protein